MPGLMLRNICEVKGLRTREARIYMVADLEECLDLSGGAEMRWKSIVWKHMGVRVCLPWNGGSRLSGSAIVNYSGPRGRGTLLNVYRNN